MAASRHSSYGCIEV